MWRAAAERRYERPLDVEEKVFLHKLKSVGAREHYAITLTVKIALDPSLGDPSFCIREAWKAMRFHFPDIACTQDGSSKVYEVSDIAGLEEWLDRTFVVEPGDRSLDDLFGSFEAMSYVSLHYLPRHESVAIHAPHWMIDLIGCLHLLDQLCQNLAEPKHHDFVTEHLNLLPSVEVAGRLDDTPEIVEKVMQGFIKAAQAPTMELPASSTTRKDTKTQWQERRYDEDLTDKILRCCKERGWGITAAAHAALAQAVLDLRSSDSIGDKLAAGIPINLRPYMPTPYNSKSYPVNSMALQQSHSLHVNQTFAGLASDIQRINRDEAAKAETLRLYKGSTRTMYENWPAGHSPPPMARVPQLNSLGVLEKYFAPGLTYCTGSQTKVQVIDMDLRVEQLLQPLVYLWTFRGKLRLTALSNEALYDERQIEELLDAMQAKLLEGLAVPGPR